MIRLACACAVVACACGDAAEVSPPPECTALAAPSCSPWSGSARTFDVAITLGPLEARGDRWFSAGFDLDCRTSHDEGPGGCYQADLAGPRGQPGIDNQLGAIVAGSYEVSARAHVELYEVEPATGERCAGVRFLDADGALLAEATAAPGARGALYARFDALPLLLDVRRSSGSEPFARVPLDLHRVHTTLEIDDGTLEGMVGGEIEVEAGVGAVVAADPALDPEVVEGIGRGQADLHPSDGGLCSHLSAGFTVTSAVAE